MVSSEEMLYRGSQMEIQLRLGHISFLSSPLSWVSPSSHDSGWFCLGTKRNWVSRRRRQPWDFLDARLCWFIHQCTPQKQSCEEGFITNNHPKVSVGLFPWWSARTHSGAYSQHWKWRRCSFAASQVSPGKHRTGGNGKEGVCPAVHLCNQKPKLAGGPSNCICSACK